MRTARTLMSSQHSLLAFEECYLSGGTYAAAHNPPVLWWILWWLHVLIVVSNQKACEVCDLKKC